MIGLACAVIASPLLILIVLQLIKDVVGRIKLKFYTSQGVKTLNIPLSGAYKHFHPPAVPSKDLNRPMRDFMEQHEFSRFGMLASNTFDSTEPTIYLTSIPAITEFLTKENDFYVKNSPAKSHVDDTFFFEHGEAALRKKQTFSQFFSHSNVLKMMPTMQKIFYERFKSLNDLWKNGENLQDWKTVQMNDLLHKCFDDAVNILIFGENSPEKVPYVNGKPLSQASEEFFQRIATLIKSPLHILTLGLSTKLRLTALARKTYQTYHKIT